MMELDLAGGPQEGGHHDGGFHAELRVDLVVAEVVHVLPLEAPGAPIRKLLAGVVGLLLHLAVHKLGQVHVELGELAHGVEGGAVPPAQDLVTRRKI